MKRYYENKDILSNQRKLYYEKNRYMLLLKSKLNQQKRNYEKKHVNNKKNNSIKSSKVQHKLLKC